MKKLLLTTTALITLVAVGAEAAPKKAKHKAHAKVEHKASAHEHEHKHHSSFKVDLHGRQEFNLAVRSVKKDYDKGLNEGKLTTGQKNFGFDSNTKVSLEVSSVADNGLKYGANIALAPNAKQNNRNFSGMDKTFLFMEGGFGRLEAGSNYSVSTLMEIGAHSVAAGTGGASDGYWSDYANIVKPVDGTDVSTVFTLSGRNYLYRNLTDSQTLTESARKISFMSPRFSGLQLGLSYTPDQDNNGSNFVRNDTNEFNMKNVFGVALNYDHKMSGMDFSGTVFYNGGKNTVTTQENLSEWGVGAKVAKGPLSFAASYDDAKKTNQIKTEAAVDGKNRLWTVGVGYEMNKLTASLTFMSAKAGDKFNAVTNNMSKTTAWSVGLDYMIASGLKTYAEYTQFTLKNPLLQAPSYEANKGSVFLAGAVVKF
jgi:outer membrane protein OmpU